MAFLEELQALLQQYEKDVPSEVRAFLFMPRSSRTEQDERWMTAHGHFETAFNAKLDAEIAVFSTANKDKRALLALTKPLINDFINQNKLHVVVRTHVHMPD